MDNLKLVKTLLKSVFLLAVMALFWFGSGKALASDVSGGVTAEKITIVFFHSATCPHCKVERSFLDKLRAKYSDIEIVSHEISDLDNQSLYQEYGKRLGVPESALAIYAVPLTVIKDKYFLGFQTDETTGKEIEAAIDLLRNGQAGGDNGSRTGFTFFGRSFRIDSSAPLPLLAVIFGLADGINPCMFSVLMMLLAYLLSVGSARRAIVSGILFGVSVFAIYFLMMVGIYKSLFFFGQNLANWMAPLKMFFGIVFVGVGGWMAKDFFFLKKGQKISFSIPQAAHPFIKKLVRRSSFLAVVVLALFSSLVELPCTFALPLGYVAILASRNVTAFPYIVLYNLFFVLPLFVIVGGVGLGFSKINRLQEWREGSKKTMRFVSGLLLLLLGLAFLLKIF